MLLKTSRVLMAAIASVAASASWSFATVTLQTVGPYNITFYNNGDSDGTSSGGQDWTSQQRADVVATVSTWTGSISNAPVRQIELHMFWANLSGLTLGSSSNPIWNDGTNAWTQTELVWRERYNPGATADARITYDTDAAGYGWSFGAADPGASHLDFRSVVTHEIGHTLGFVTTYNSSTDKFEGGLTEMSKYMRDDAGNRPVANGTGTPGNFNQVDNPVWFVGPNAMAANGGNPVAIYAPSTYTPGSSLSHLDENTYPFALMSPQIGLGQVSRTPSAVEWGMMKDFGWTVVPEPSLIMLAAGPLVGMLRRRRTAE